MKGSTSLAIALLAMGIGVKAETLASAQPLAFTKPSPGPCCADGKCRPKRDTWGHYKTRWRQWPLDPRAEVPGPEPDDAPVDGILPPDAEAGDREE